MTEQIIKQRIENIESIIQEKKLEFSKLQTKYELLRNDIEHSEYKIRMLQEILDSLTHTN